jgi:hypothetical protein
MTCDILDIRCIFVNELIGSVLLSCVLLAILYFIIATKLKLGFDTAMVMGVPLILSMGLYLGGFSVLYAFISLIAGFLIALAILRLLGNK